MNQSRGIQNKGEKLIEKELLRKIAEILLQEHLLTAEEEIAFNQILQKA